jgi:uncharacterized membrane protein YdjX (TVP38/TMEM64 family)
MNGYILAALLVSISMLAMFGLASLLGIQVLTTDGWVYARSPATAAWLCVALLVADAFLPVPSSLLQIALGALLGPWAGSLAAFAGASGSAGVAFWFGGRGSPLLARCVQPAEKKRAAALVNHWGVYAIALTRPIPVIAETTAVMAGAIGMPWRGFLASMAIGNLPVAMLYAVLGDAARRGDMTVGILIVPVLLGIAALIYWSRARRWWTS